MQDQDPWTQLTLLPVEVVLLEVKVGVVMETNHVQWQVTARDGSTGSLIAMLSTHHMQAQLKGRWSTEIREELLKVFEEHCAPF